MAAGDTLTGRRVYVDPETGFVRAPQPGDYYFDPEFDTWYVKDPAGQAGALINHEIVEHEDGTITVSPSILDPAPGGWHGYLERGIWREV